MGKRSSCKPSLEEINMEKKTSFILYPADFLAAVHNFKKNQVHDLIIALCEFNLYGRFSFNLSDTVKERFDVLQNIINVNNAKYAEICEKRKASGAKGGSKSKAKSKQTSEINTSPPPEEKEKDNESVNESDDVFIKNKNKDEKIVDNSVFVGAPTVEEVATYCQESGYTIDPEAFVRWNEARGWMNGKKYIALDWRKAVRKWYCKENGLSNSEMELMTDICKDMLSKAKAVRHD